MKRIALTLVAVATALSIAACGSFDSASSGNALIKAYLNKEIQSGLKIDSLSTRCPSGKSSKSGTSYQCPVTLKVSKGSQSQTLTGTVTVHVTKNHVQIYGRQDVHLQ